MNPLTKNDTSETALCEFLIRVRNVAFQHDCSATSWIRTPKRNMSVGGKPSSHHLTGFAVDLVPDSWPVISPDLLSDLIKYKLHYLIEKDHIHVQAFTANSTSHIV